MKVAIYARYSSDNQREASIEDQVRVCKSRVRQEGWTLVATYVDRGLSGASVLRPGYQQLLEDAGNAEFDVVMAEALDRLSRDQENIAGLYKRLFYLGITLVTVAEGEITELHIGLKGTMNALFLKDLAQKTHRGLEGRVRHGRSAGGRVYGYDIVKEVGSDGEPVRGGRVINRIEARIVRRIFREFASGKSPTRIARALNGEGILGPGGRPWQGNTISGHSRRRNGILRNEIYIGRLVWNRQHFVKDPATGKRQARLNPESEWVIKEVPKLRIVDDDLWSRVAERLEEQERSPKVRRVRESRFWEKRRPGYLLTGLVKCGHCGRNFTSVGGDYIACAGARKMGICSNRKGLRREILEDFVLDTLKDHLMHPDLVKEFIAEFLSETNRFQAERDQLVSGKKRQLARVTRRLEGLIDAIADGLRSPGLKQKLDALEQEKAELERELAKDHAPALRLHPNLADVYRRKVEELKTALADPSLRDEALGILRDLISSVTVSAAGDGFDVDFEGEIARMIQLPDGESGPDDDHFRISVKRVAGARNRLYLLLFARGLPKFAR